MSNYNYGLEPGIQRNGSSRLRFVLIFLAVSALTAALLWWFWPGKDEENSEKKESVPSVTSSETQTLQPVVKEPEITPAPAPAPAAPQPVEKDPQKQDGKKSGETGVSADKKNDPADPPLPEKGVITPADKEGADLPAIPVDSALSEEQEKAFQQAETLFAAKDFAGAEKMAEKALAGVVENSAFYRKVWRILSDARIEMAFNGKKNPYVVTYQIRSGDSLNGS